MSVLVNPCVRLNDPNHFPIFFSRQKQRIFYHTFATTGRALVILKGSKTRIRQPKCSRRILRSFTSRIKPRRWCFRVGSFIIFPQWSNFSLTLTLKWILNSRSTFANSTECCSWFQNLCVTIRWSALCIDKFYTNNINHSPRNEKLKFFGHDTKFPMYESHQLASLVDCNGVYVATKQQHRAGLQFLEFRRLGQEAEIGLIIFASFCPMYALISDL